MLEFVQFNLRDELDRMVCPGLDSKADSRVLMRRGKDSYLEAIKNEFSLRDHPVIQEADIILNSHSRQQFRQAVEADPDAIHVAPYLLFPKSTGLEGPVWAHRQVLRFSFKERKLLEAAWIKTGDSRAELFGFGCIYIPREIFYALYHTILDQYPDRDFKGKDHNLDHYFSLVSYMTGLKAKVEWKALAFHSHY